MPIARPRSKFAAIKSGLKTNFGLSFQDYNHLWRWSVTDLRCLLAQHLAVRPNRVADSVRRRTLCRPQCRGQYGSKARGSTNGTACVSSRRCRGGTGQTRDRSENELGETREKSVGLNSSGKSHHSLLRCASLGVERGDRVAAYSPTVRKRWWRFSPAPASAPFGAYALRIWAFQAVTRSLRPD